MKLASFIQSRRLHLTTLTRNRRLAVKFEDSKKFSNPVNALQEQLRVPVLRPGEKLFVPTQEKMREAETLFVPRTRHKIDMVGSTVSVDGAPKNNLPEVAVIGQSNVGKSSLIRTLLSKIPDIDTSDFVRVSSTPGHTKTANFFQVGRKFTMVDMPGYGRNQPRHFVETVEGYLKNRQNLRMTIFLVSGEVGVTKDDMIAIRMMEEIGRPYTLVMTKIDKTNMLGRIQSLVQVKELRDKFTSSCCFHQPFLISSKTGEGIGLLQCYIVYVTGNIELGDAGTSTGAANRKQVGS
ncbi:PREDICTED: GTP-binding protein 8-like [Priapulus caudatus]|uniref:GTP-binding protein 8 n=1 Tax=Priapulus caudatus TaxID=37621 RepID=A0ABM1E3T2_PRICU|nr:PREDICTED: GTP-binding protein 8-like [Priapulus caudatus]